MGITVTANPNGTPPFFRITVSSSNGSAITSVTLKRTSNGYTETSPWQPSTGPSPRVVDDTEAAWSTPVTYSATVVSSAGTETFTATPATITSPTAWMIHPTIPGLSCILDTKNFATAGIISIGAVARPSNAVAHDIIGSAYRLYTTSGPRNASRLQLAYATVTDAERSRFVAMVQTQTPILFRIPTEYGWSWEDGYYNIDDVTEERFFQYGPETRRNWTLPLERVPTPAGIRQTTRSYNDVKTGFSSYTAVSNAYASYTDLITDTRR